MPAARQATELPEYLTFDDVLLQVKTYYVDQVSSTSFVAHGTESFYLALANEKFFAFARELGRDRVGMLTGDASINGAAPVIVK